jgi:hypothetical protein
VNTNALDPHTFDDVGERIAPDSKYQIRCAFTRVVEGAAKVGVAPFVDDRVCPNRIVQVLCCWRLNPPILGRRQVALTTMEGYLDIGDGKDSDAVVTEVSRVH